MQKLVMKTFFMMQKKYVCPSFDDVLFVIRGLNIADSLIRDYI